MWKYGKYDLSLSYFSWGLRLLSHPNDSEKQSRIVYLIEIENLIEVLIYINKFFYDIMSRELSSVEL